ncbi:MAG: L-serine ammonia-lyase [candidate division WOR-3 bacterium]|nr:L-serine ammonia-lyase [candidate division WOR-3 bacterium]
MESIRELFRVGKGPSSSHTMGPALAAKIFKEKNPDAISYRVTLYGSLAATGKGHLTEEALREILPEEKTTIIKKEKFLRPHPNAMLFEAEKKKGKKIKWLVFSTGGGSIKDLKNIYKMRKVYPHKSFKEIFEYCLKNGITLYEYVFRFEDKNIKRYLLNIWNTMEDAIKRGLKAEGVLPGPLKLERRASSMYIRSCNSRGIMERIGRVFSYALAVAEENANGGIVVTAPTCGSSGVLPSVLKYLKESYKLREEKIINALAISGLFGNLIKHNASISGAEVGCQGEIGTACSMAAAAATYLLGGSAKQMEYAAEMGLEHHLGLTCDPVAGMVQVPCIERNAMAAERALDCAVYALQTDGTHKITFDEVVRIMKQTGQDMKVQYRETARAGLATVFKMKR